MNILSANFFSNYSISPVWLLLVVAVQTLLCKFAFLDGSGGGKFLVITNRCKLMHITNCSTYKTMNVNIICICSCIPFQERLQLGLLLLFPLQCYCGPFRSHCASTPCHAVWNIATLPTGYQHYDEWIAIC